MIGSYLRVKGDAFIGNGGKGFHEQTVVFLFVWGLHSTRSHNIHRQATKWRYVTTVTNPFLYLTLWVRVRVSRMWIRRMGD